MIRNWFVCGLAILVLSGCGSGLETYPVTGTVKHHDGAPVAGGTVTFEAIGQTLSASGVIGSDGQFELSTAKRGDGAVPGKYRVVVAAPTAVNAKMLKTIRPVPAKYRRFETSGLEFEVTSDRRQNEFHIVLDQK